MSDLYISNNKEYSSMNQKNGCLVNQGVIGNAVENIFKKYDENHNNFIDLD